MKKLTVQVPKAYDVLIDNGILSKCAELIKRYAHQGKICIITDSNVKELYAEPLELSLGACGFSTCKICIPAGEASKNLSTVSNIYKDLASFGISRGDSVLALGGGVVGDIAGFSAATYLRGVKFFQIPTTLLSQTDSSIGGKNGVNTTYGKNLVGAFYNPSAVFVDPLLLTSLSQSFFDDGMSEVIKYALIKDESFFCSLRDGVISLDSIVYRCLSIKKDFVEADENDFGVRTLLNFGHTIGHALEKLSYYKLSHGKAVAIGMYIITCASEEQGLTEKGTSKEILSVLKKYNLPYRVSDSLNIPKEKLVSMVCDAISTDKKMCGNCINLVLLKNIGHSYIHKILYNDLSSFLSGGLYFESSKNFVV